MNASSPRQLWGSSDGITTHQPFGSNSVYHFVYDYRNRLTEVRDGSETPKLFVKYTYDGLNRRIRKVKYDADGDPTADTWYFWNGWQAIEERDHLSSDAVLRRYAWGVKPAVAEVLVDGRSVPEAIANGDSQHVVGTRVMALL